MPLVRVPGRYFGAPVPTPVITHWVASSLHVEYKRCHIKHDTYDLGL